MKNKSISVVIPTYNQKKFLLEAVGSLLKQTYPVAEIIVVDNASTDGTTEAVKKFIKKLSTRKVKLVENKTNEGVTGGRNAGIKIAKGEYVLFFDHDMVANKDMVEIMVRCLESNKKIGIVTPKIYFWDKKNIIWSAGTDVNLWTGQTIFYGGEDKGQYNVEKEVAVAPAVLLVKKEVLKKIGGFDPIYFATYEDTDFCFRAKRKGYVTYYSPTAIAYHHIPYDEDLANRRLLSRAYWVARNRIIFMKRYGKNFILFLSFLPIFFLYYFALAIKYNDTKAVAEYLKGTVNGILGNGIKLLPFTYPWIMRSMFTGAATVLDVGCGDGALMKKINFDGKYNVTGIDLYNPYVVKARESGVYENVLLGDIRNLKLKEKSFDIVFSSQVVEHLTKKEALKLIKEMEKYAKKKVIIGTTHGYFPFDPLEGKDGNPLQVHKSGWEVSEMRQYGYKIFGQGLGFVYKPSGLAHRIKNNFTRNFLYGFSYVLAPVTYIFPSISAYIIAVKIYE